MRSQLVKFLIYFSALLPLRLAHLGAELIGRMAWLFPLSCKNTALRNIALCLPHLTPYQKRMLAHSSFIELCKSAAELGPLWRWRKTRVLKLVTGVSGEHRLRDALAAGKGVILALPHLGAWEMIGNYCSSRYPMTSLYRPPRLAALEALMLACRQRFGAQLVPTRTAGIRRAYQALGENQVVAILPDQDPAQGGAVLAPFFSVMAPTMTLLSKLANRTGAVVIWAYAERLKRGRGYYLHFFEATARIAADDLTHAATALNAGIENCVLRLPAQYQWCYKRFKTRSLWSQVA